MSNVHDQLSKAKPSLVKRVIENQEVTGMVMGFINVFHGLRKIAGYPVESLAFDDVVHIGNGVFTCNIQFDHLVSSRVPMWTPETEIQQYAKSRAAHFAETLRVNPNIEKLILKIVTAIEIWADEKGCDWRNVGIDGDPPNQAVVTKDLRKLRFRVKKKLGIVLARA